MSIKLRLPEPGEERLSWCKNIKISIAGPEGLLEGSIDAQLVILDLDDYQAILRDMSDEDADADIRECLETHVRDVRGFKDEDGEPWSSSDQVEFVTRSADVASTLFNAYTNHVFGGKLKKGSSGRSRGRRSRDNRS